MLILKLYPSEFRELIGYLKFNTEYQETVPLQYQTIHKLVMLNYISKWTPIRVYTWKQKNPKKAHALRIPIVVALTLWQEMKFAMLTGHQQLLLNKLDYAIVSYQNPNTVDAF